MAKRRRKRDRRPVPTREYSDPEGNSLTLRCELSAGTVRKLAEPPTSAAASYEDAWQRREELLFERLAVRWEIAGLPIEDQKTLLGRYRMASAGERRWIRETIAGHLTEHIPELAPGG